MVDRQREYERDQEVDPPTQVLPAQQVDEYQDETQDDDRRGAVGTWLVGGLVGAAALIMGALFYTSVSGLAQGAKQPESVTSTMVVTSTQVTEVTTTRVAPAPAPTSTTAPKTSKTPKASKTSKKSSAVASSKASMGASTSTATASKTKKSQASKTTKTSPTTSR
ncbi:MULTISPECIES: hypothetical protein [Corynebacterium]|uniref:hypothetical protein n=1 Tax=Corynebacterium TaxID=1716 RepID=UPI00105484B1|nr:MULTISPECIES: hypothetical protein [Corynebacterium]